MRPHLWQPHRLKSDAFDVASNNQIEAAEEKIDASLFSSFFPPNEDSEGGRATTDKLMSRMRFAIQACVISNTSQMIPDDGVAARSK